jgi:tetratricopeptide (TPR) repeat protein
MLLLVDEMVEELVTELRPILGSALSARVARGRTSDVEAWGNLQHSKNLVGEARRFAARGAGAQAIELLDLADSLAQRAVERDPEWPDARLQLADVGREWTSALLAGPRPDFSEIARRLEAAATVLEQAAARWPMEALVAQLAGSVAFERWLAERPPRAEYQLGEATRFLRRAITLDPYAARPWVTLSAIHAARLEHAASAVAAQGALRRDVFGEHTDEIHNRLFNASFELGRDDEAALWCDAINDRGPGRTLGAFCLLTLQGWTSVREPDLTAVDSVVDNLNADPLPLVAIMKPRLRMLKAAVVSRSGDPRVARVLLDSAAAEAKAMGDTDAAAFHAAALIRLGDLATAREVLRKWSASNEKRLPLQRWFHPLNDSGPFSRRQVADPSGSALTLAPASLAPAIEIEPEFVAPSSKQYQKPLTR